MSDESNKLELLDTYSLKGVYLGKREKKAAHEEMRKEFIKTSKVSSKHKTIRLLLLNSNGRLILQRRSKWKGDNAGLWDKTIGGHVSSGDQPDLAVSKECSEELGIPATVVKEEEFETAIRTTNLAILAIIKKMENIDNHQSKRRAIDGSFWFEPSMTTFYLGYYDGSMRFIDSESCGIQVFSVEELEVEIKNHPQDFTEDIKYMLKWKQLMKPIKKEQKIMND